MKCTNTIAQLVKNKSIITILKKGSKSKDKVRDLQTLLYELGFEKELKWSKYGADGDYGSATKAAVKAFKDKNCPNGGGQRVNLQTGKMLLKRFDSLDELQQLNADIKFGKLSAYKQGSKDKTAVAALQTLLNDLGYGQELKWEKYRNDGDYGSCTIAALQAFANQSGIQTSGTKLSKSMAGFIIGKLAVYYGSGWTKTRKTTIKTKGKCALTTFTASNFVGNKLTTDVQFVPALKRINGYARQNDVLVHITSSFRTSSNVGGAIVPPAKMSNHMAGHAIDMNLRYGRNHGSWCNSTCLGKTPLPAPVRGFINAIKKDKGLRWGGDFRRKDPVHIDDHLNKDKNAWQQRYEAMQKARQSGCG